MVAILARAVAEWTEQHPGQRPEIRRLRHRSIEPGEQADVRSDPPKMFATDTFVIARAAEDFIVSSVSSTPSGVVISVVNVSRSSMPRRFDGWLVGRSYETARDTRWFMEKLSRLFPENERR